jgi:hypothetical protein
MNIYDIYDFMKHEQPSDLVIPVRPSAQTDSNLWGITCSSRLSPPAWRVGCYMMRPWHYQWRHAAQDSQCPCLFEIFFDCFVYIYIYRYFSVYIDICNIYICIYIYMYVCVVLGSALTLTTPNDRYCIVWMPRVLMQPLRYLFWQGPRVSWSLINVGCCIRSERVGTSLWNQETLMSLKIMKQHGLRSCQLMTASRNS